MEYLARPDGDCGNDDDDDDDANEATQSTLSVSGGGASIVSLGLKGPGYPRRPAGRPCMSSRHVQKCTSPHHHLNLGPDFLRHMTSVLSQAAITFHEGNDSYPPSSSSWRADVSLLAIVLPMAYLNPPPPMHSLHFFMPLASETPIVVMLLLLAIMHQRSFHADHPRPRLVPGSSPLPSSTCYVPA